MSFLERSKLKNVIQNTTSLILEEKRNLDTNSFENQINSNDNMSNHYEYEERDQFFNDLVFDGNINRNSSLSQKEYNKVNDIKSSGNDNHEENTCNNYKNEGIYSKFTIEKVSNFYNFFEIINLTFVKKYFYRIFFINKKKFGLKYCIEDSISINNRDKEIKINNILSFEKMNFIEFSNKNIEKFISILFNFIHNFDNLTKKKTIYFFKNKKEENFDTTPKEKNIVYIKSILSNSVRTYSSKIKKTNKKSNSGISYLIENNQEPSSIDNSDPPPILKKELSQKNNSIDNSIEGLLNSNNNNYFESVYCTPLNNQKFIRFTSKIDNKENSNDLFKDSNKIATLKDSFNTNSLNLINLEDTKNDAFNNNESSNDLFFKKIKNSSENERRITLMNEVNQKYINLIENINRSHEKEKIINHDQTIKILNNKDNSTGLNENSDKDLQMSNNIIHQVLISKEKENNQMNYKSKDFDHHENENDNLKKINTIENKNSLIFSLNFANSVENNNENKNKILNNLQSSNSLLNSKNDFFIKEITIKSKNKFSKNKIIDKQLYKLNDKKSGLNISNSNNINENETRNIIRNNMKNTFEIDNSQDLVNKNYLDKNLIENNNDNSQISNQNNHYLEDNDIFSKISEEIKIEDNSDKRYQSFDIENVLNKLPIETYVSKNNMKIKEISIENNTINVKKSEMATINNNNNYEKTNIILSKEVDLDTKGIIIKTNDTQDNINTNLNHHCLINESKLTKSENKIFFSENPTSNLKRIENPANNLNQANFSKYSKDIDKKVYFSEINQKLNSDFSKNSEIEDSQIDNVEDKNYNLPLSTKFENRIFTPKFKNRNNNQSLDTINSEKKNSTAMTTLILNELKTQFNNQTIEDVKKPIKFYFLEPSNKILIQIVSASYKPNLNSNEGSSLHNFKIISESNCCIVNSNHDFNSIANSATINNLNAANWEKVLSVCNEISMENICQISQINENVNIEGTNNLIPKSEFKEDIIKIIDTDFINLDFNTQTFQNILNNEIDTLQPNQDVILNDLPIYSQDIINEDYPKFKIEINNKYPITNKRNVCKKDLTLNHKVKTYKNSTSSTNDFSQFKNKNEIFHKSTNLNNNYSIYFKRKSIDKFSNNSAAISHKKTKDLKNDAESKNNGINFDSQIISQTFSDDNNISSLNFKPNIVRENFFHTSSTKTEDLIMSNRSNNNNEEFSIEKEKKDALDVNFKRNSNSNKNIYFKNKNLLFEENNLNNFSNIRKNDINIKNNYLSNSDICNNNKTIPISTLKYDDINKKKILEKQYSSNLESQKLPVNSVYKTVNDCPYKTEMLESKDFYKNSESVKESELFKKVLTNHFSLNKYSENDKNKYKSNLAKNENSNNNIVNRNLYQNLKIDNSVNLSKISQKKIDLEENEKFNSTLTDLYLNTNDKSKSNLIISKKISNNSNDDVKQIKGINSKSLSINTLSNQFKNMIKILVFILEKLFVKNKKIFFIKLPQKLNTLSSSISKTYIEKKNHVSNNQNKNKSTLINRNKYFSEEYLSINKKRVISSKIIIKLIKRRLIFFKLIFFNRGNVIYKLK